MWELDHKEGWVPKNWCFWSVVPEKILESSLDSKMSNQSIPKEINPEYSLEGLMMKLKLENFGHLMQRLSILEKTLMLGKIEDRMKRGQQRIKWWKGIIDTMDVSLCKLSEIVKDRKPGMLQFMGLQRHNLANVQNSYSWVTDHVSFFFFFSISKF